MGRKQRKSYARDKTDRSKQGRQTTKQRHAEIGEKKLGKETEKKEMERRSKSERQREEIDKEKRERERERERERRTDKREARAIGREKRLTKKRERQERDRQKRGREARGRKRKHRAFPMRDTVLIVDFARAQEASW